MYHRPVMLAAVALLAGLVLAEGFKMKLMKKKDADMLVRFLVTFKVHSSFVDSSVFNGQLGLMDFKAGPACPSHFLGPMFPTGALLMATAQLDKLDTAPDAPTAAGLSDFFTAGSMDTADLAILFNSTMDGFVTMDWVLVSEEYTAAMRARGEKPCTTRGPNRIADRLLINWHDDDQRTNYDCSLLSSGQVATVNNLYTVVKAKGSAAQEKTIVRDPAAAAAACPAPSVATTTTTRTTAPVPLGLEFGGFAFQYHTQRLAVTARRMHRFVIRLSDVGDHKRNTALFLPRGAIRFTPANHCSRTSTCSQANKGLCGAGNFCCGSNIRVCSGLCCAAPGDTCVPDWQLIPRCCSALRRCVHQGSTTPTCCEIGQVCQDGVCTGCRWDGC